MYICTACNLKMSGESEAYGLCPACYTTVEAMADARNIAIMVAVGQLKEVYRKDLERRRSKKPKELELMKCRLCGKEGKTIEPIWDTCQPCYKLAQAHSRMTEIEMSHAVEVVREFRMYQQAERRTTEVYNTSEDDETLDIIRITKPLTSEDYREREYDFLNLEVLHYENREDELNVLNQLLDMALLGNDIEWAKSLHKQIKRAKEHVQ